MESIWSLGSSATTTWLAVEGGRLAFEAGRIPRRVYATASSPLEGVVGR